MGSKLGKAGMILGIIGLSFKSTRIITINGVQQENRQDSYLTMNDNGKKFMDIING